METVELSSLIGKHFLTGVDYSTEPVKQYDWDESMTDCQVIRFTLDGKTYIATEDPSDGYRSSLKSIFVTKDKIKNTFNKVMVFGIMKPPSNYNNNDTIQFYDVETGKVVLEVGTDNHDDYYPSFVGVFYPENLVLNRAVGKV